MCVRSLCVLLVLVVWCSEVGVVLGQLVPVGCDLSRVPVQPNFDTKRYVGRWWELLWVAPIEEKDYDSTDYYWQLQNATHEGVIQGYQSGRDPGSNRCFGATVTLNETHTPGLFLMTTSVDNYITRYYVMDTDYDTYANAYGCYEYSSDGTRCYKGRAWLWARGSDLPTHLRQKVLKSWESLCLDMEALLKVTPVTGHDCPNRG